MEPGMEVLTVTKSEVIKEFFKKSVLPVAVAALLYCIFKSACTKDGVTDYVWLFILCGLPCPRCPSLFPSDSGSPWSRFR